MTTDFQDAHERHWSDAEFLFQESRWANADHLYGIAAECGLKRLMIAFGMPFDSKNDMPKDRQDRTHIDIIQKRYETYRSGNLGGVGYELPDPGAFDDWNASQRYEPRGNFDRKRTEAHRKGAEDVRYLVQHARKEGLL
jgi:hypothetical protein